MKLLLVAYYFPPFKEVGAVRVSKLVKYFSRFGWEIEVITVDDCYYNSKSIDKEKLKDIPSTVNITKTERMTLNLKIREEGFYWKKHLYRTLNKKLKESSYDYIYYTAGPFFHLSVAPKIKKKYNIPYIIDYRDPWLLSPYNNSKFFKTIAKLVEPKVVKEAKYLINVTEDATKMHRDYYKEENKEKFITIENGYDPEDFFQIEDININDTKGINLIYTGKLGSFRDITPLLDAIKEYNSENNKKIFFIHIGNKEVGIKNYKEKNKDMNGYIIEKGFLPYKETLGHIKKSNLTIIISGGHPYEPTTKIYDYMALKKKILCINDIEYGYLFNTLKNKENCQISINKKENIKENIKKILEKSDNFSDIQLNDFNREKIFEKLSGFLIANK